MSLRLKLLMGFVSIALFVALLGFLGIVTSQRAQSEFDLVITSSVPKLQALLDLARSSSEISVLSASLNTELGESTSSAAITADNKSLFLSKLSDLSRSSDEYAKNVSSNDKNEQSLLVAITDARDQVQTFGLDLILSKEKELDPIIVKQRQDRLNKAASLLSNLANEAVAIEIEALEDRNQDLERSSQQIINVDIVFTIGAFAVSVIIGALISNSIAKRMTILKNATKEIASGKFEKQVEVRGNDEVSQLAVTFNEMSLKLKDLYQTLEEERAKDEALLANLAEGMVAVNTQANITKMNAVAQKVLGIDDSCLSKSVFECFTLFDKDGTELTQDQHPAKLALTKGILVDEVYELRKAEDKKVLVGILANPVKQKETVIGVIMVVRDVTKEREVDRMKTEFISLASHQLRTPLSAIKWFTEMLLSGDGGVLNSEQQDFTKNISDSTERMIQLVNSLLNISRIESGRIVIDPKPTNLGQLVQGIVNDLQAKIQERQQNLIVSVHPGLPEVSLDPRLIGQVYMNLLTNAIKYTPKGGDIQIFISKKDDQIISQVTDTGFGIPKEQHEKVFQKFFRAENVVKVETDGTGLGLYLIKAIIDSSGGKIWFESEEGKGTTFWFSLPASGMKPKKGEVTLD